MLLSHNVILPYGNRFKRDEKDAFIPSDYIIDAIKEALIFYLVKKNKSVEKYILKEVSQIDSIKDLEIFSEKIKNSILNRENLLNNINMPSKIYLPKDGIYNLKIQSFDLEKKEFIEQFESEGFKGTIQAFELNSPNIQIIKDALLSFSKSLTDYEHKMIKDTTLEPIIIDLQNFIANEWNMTIRIGKWNIDDSKNKLLFLWRIKEVRELIQKRFKMDVRPKSILYVPKFKEFVGWCEIA